MAECVLPSPRKENRISNDSDSPADEAAVPKRQKEMVKLKYSRRRRRVKKRIVKPPSNSSDSEPTASANKSLELLSICEGQNLRYSIGGITSATTHTLESSFSIKCGGDPSLTSMHADGCSSITKWNEFDFMLSQPSPQKPAVEKEETKLWFSGLLGSIFSFMSTRLFNSKQSAQNSDVTVNDAHFIGIDENYQLSLKHDFDECIEEMVEKIIQRVVEFCPDQYIEDLNQRCLFQLKHKLNQRGVTIGISGKSQYGKNLLMKAIEKQSLESTRSSDVTYRMCSCPSLDCENTSEWYFMLEEATCAGLIHITSTEDGLETIDQLKWLIERDKDVISQGRVLFLVNQIDTNSSGSFTSSLPLTIDATDISEAHRSHYFTPVTNTDSPITTSLNVHHHSSSTPITARVSSLTHSLTPVSTASSYPYSIGSIITMNTQNDSARPCTAGNQHQSIVKQRMKTCIEEKIGAAIPDSCVLLSSLDLSEHSNNRCSTEVCQEDGSDATLLHHGFEFEDERIESLTDEDLGVAKWLHQVSVNCDRLRQLSIISDTIYCIEYCCNRLRYLQDELSEDINKYEELLVHKAHIMMKMKRKWRTIEMRSKETSLYQELSASYEKDIEGTLRGLEECAHNIFDRFYDICSTKLDRLAFRGKAPNGGTDLCQLFKTDVEVFSDEVIQCSQMAQSNLLFLNMQNVLQRWYRRLGAQHSLERLAEEFMNFEVNGDLSSHSSAESSGYCRDDSNVASIFPCSLQTIEGHNCLKFESVKEVLYSVVQCLVSRNQAEMKKSKRCFVNLCGQHLQSEHTRIKSVQYHVDLLSDLISKHLEAFQDVHVPRFKDLYHQLEIRVANVKHVYKITEMQLKHLINLKVHMEVQKSHYSYCLK